MAASKPRVLVLTPDYPPTRGGIQHLVHRLVSNLARMTVRVLAPGAAGFEIADRAEGLDVVRVGTMLPRRTALAVITCRAPLEAARFRPDVILSAHVVMSPGARAAALARRTPIVQYLYADEVRLRPGLVRSAQRRARASIAISRYTRGLALGVGGDPARLMLIAPGVDVGPPFPSGPRDGPPTIVTVARIQERYKGHDVLARALPLVLSRVPDARWVVIGSGPLRGAIESLAAATGVSEQVVFTGSIGDTDRDAWLDRAHVFAMPSRIPSGLGSGEGFGIAYLEAGAHGLPVVAGNVAGALDAVTDGETGVLVDPTDHVAVADVLTSLLLDPDLAARLGCAGRRRAEASAWPVAARKVEDLLLEVAAGRGPRASR